MALAVTVVGFILTASGFALGYAFGRKKGFAVADNMHSKTTALQRASTEELLEQLSRREVEGALPATNQLH